MIKNILVPVDGSEHMFKAIEFAAAQSRQNDATVQLLHVVEQVVISDEIEHFIRSENIQDTPKSVYLKLMGSNMIERAEEQAKNQGIKNIEANILAGDLAQQIVSYAKDNDTDMIVMGSRGLGSVAGRVCKMTDRTCVIVRKSLLEGKKPPIAVTNPIGCNVKWKGQDAHWMPPEACDLV